MNLSVGENDFLNSFDKVTSKDIGCKNKLDILYVIFVFVFIFKITVFTYFIIFTYK